MQSPIDSSRWEGEGRPRNDLRMVMAAIRAGWSIDPVIKQAIVGRASRVLANPESKSRDVARASATIISVERLALDAAKEEDRMTRLDAGTPTDRVEILRKAFMATLADAAVVAEFAKINITNKPLAGAELQALVKRLYATDEKIVALARAAQKPPAGK